MQKKLIIIKNSIGFALRSIRTIKYYIDYLVKQETEEVLITIFTYSFFKEVVIETFHQTGAKVTFESIDDNVINDEYLAKIACNYGVKQFDIITESLSMKFLLQNMAKDDRIIFDNLNQPHINPNEPSLYVKEETIKVVKNELINVAIKAKKNTNIKDAKVIFLPFSGLKALGTDYGKNEDEKQKLIKFMSFPLEDIIPTIKHIQEELKKHKIVAIPVPIQYGNLMEIHQEISLLSTKHGLNPKPTSLDIDWNRDFAKQIGFFHAINQWSEEVKLPNLAVVHGSSSLHLIEECVNPGNIVVFYGTHTEKIKLEDDGRVYHLAVAEKSNGWLRAIYPPISNSHRYKLVAEQIVEQASKAVIEKYYSFSDSDKNCFTN